MESIKVDGLKQFVRSLKSLDSNLPKALKAGFNDAAKLVVDTAKPKVPIGPPQGGHAAASIRAASTAKSVRVAEGGARYPYMPWLDFGGKVGKENQVTRPYLKKGRYVWAAYAEHRDEIEQMVADAVTDAARAAGIEIED